LRWGKLTSHRQNACATEEKKPASESGRYTNKNYPNTDLIVRRYRKLPIKEFACQRVSR